MEARLFFTHHPLCSIFTTTTTTHRHRHPWRPKTPTQNPNLSSHSRPLCSTRYRRWDSNAETETSSQRFNFGFRAKDDDDDEDDDEEDEGSGRKKRRWWSDEWSSSTEREGGTFQEVIDGLWIIKVFRSYGWALPAILIPWLLATGPKAFLMALALPLGQSALSLAFEKLWGRTQSRPKRKSRMRRKPSASTVSSPEMEVEEQDESQETRKGKMGYQSWVVGSNGSVDNGGRDAPKFGGWDDLERSGPARRASRVTSGSGRTPNKKGKLSQRERKSDTPLLLRLLIAVFPFLGSWTKLL